MLRNLGTKLTRGKRELAGLANARWFHRSVSQLGEYKVKIGTGNRRGAGTTASVFVELVGRKASTGKVDVPGQFERDSVVMKTVSTEQDLGPIRAVHVGHDNVGGPGVGWYLEFVEIEYEDDGINNPAREFSFPTPPPPSGVSSPGSSKKEKIHLKFPVRRWLGKSDLGKGTYPLSVYLKVGIMDSMSDPSSLALSNRIIEAIQRKPLFVETGVAAFPHPDKVREGQKAFVRSDIGQAGEDAYSIAVVEHPDASALEVLRNLQPGTLTDSTLPTTLTIAVADGVFSWRNQGIDAGEWSRFLVRVIRHQMQHHVRDTDDRAQNSQVQKVATPEVAEQVTSPDTVVGLPKRRWNERYEDLGLKLPVVPLQHPMDALTAGEQKIRKTGIQGSSTACVASIHGLDRKLYVANLGDSGLLVYRPHLGVLYRTPEQEHKFGYPYQLGHHEASDHASDAMVTDLTLSEGDIVVVATDGLFDNLDDTEIISIVSKYAKLSASEEPGKPTKRTANLCAYDLAAAAFRNSVDPNSRTPWAVNASEEFDLVWRGGKQDDITVVCALVS